MRLSILKVTGVVPYLPIRLHWHKRQKNLWNHHRSKSNWTNEYCWSSVREPMVSVVPNLPGRKFNSFMKIFHFSMWLVCISIDTSIKIFVKRSFEFFLCVTQTFDLSADLSVKPWTIRCSYVRVSRGQSVTWPVLKTVQNEIGWKVHLIH